jgi:methyl-accepting chemotaxis protein
MADLKKTIQEAQSALLSESSGFAARTKRQAAVVDRLVISLEKHGEDLNRFALVQDKISDSLQNFSESSSQSRSAAELLSKEAGAVVVAVHRLSESTNAFGGVAKTLKDSTDGLGAAIERVQARIDAQIDQLRVAPSEIVIEAANSLAKSSATLREELSKLGRLQEDLAKSLGTQAATSIESIRKHNDALEAELGRSRNMVANVHTNLVSMTDELVKQIEARR